MTYAFCLTLDTASEAAVRAMWQHLAAEGICDHMVTLGYPPHLSLAVLDEEPPREIVLAAYEALNGAPALRIRLGGVRKFAGTSIAWLAVEGEAGLSEMQSRLVAHLPLEQVHPHYRPGLWMPHVTLQMKGDVERGMALVAASWPESRDARLVGFDLVQLPPLNVLDRRALA